MFFSLGDLLQTAGVGQVLLCAARRAEPQQSAADLEGGFCQDEGDR